MTAPRVPPHSTEAEQGVLGALLLDNAAFERVGDVLAPEDFYHADYAGLFRTIARLIVSNKPADVITVFEAGGHDIAAMTELQNSVASAANARRYAELVRERAVERRVAAIGDEMANRAMAGVHGDIEVQVDQAVTALLKAVESRQDREPRDLADVLPGWVDGISEMAAGKSPAMATGLADLDRLTSGGIWPGELWVIGARPSMGKSALSLTLARQMSIDYSVLFCSMEDSERTIVSRMVAAEGRINLADLRSPGRAPEEMWAGLTDGVERLGNRNLRLDDQAGLSLLEVRRKMQQVKRRHGLHVVIVDYLQLMVGEGETRNRELGDIANGLKKAAKDFGIGVVLLSQLTRKADERGGPPHMGDLRESGDIEGAADLIGMLYREHMRKPTSENKHYAELHVCKQKNGPTDTISLHFDGAFQRFSNWDGPRPYAAHRAASGGMS